MEADQSWNRVGIDSSTLARCNYMSVTRILNENRCVVRRTNDSNFRVTCGKCLNPSPTGPWSRDHGPMEAPCQDWRFLFFSKLCMPNGKWPGGKVAGWLGGWVVRWQSKECATSMATHEIRKALLQISRFIYQQFVSKCAAAQIKVPVHLASVFGFQFPDFLMPCT